HRRNSAVDPDRRTLAVPSPRARSRIPTVRISNVIEEPDGMSCSHRKNRVGDPPNANPAPIRTPAMAKAIVRSRCLVVIGDETEATDPAPAGQAAPPTMFVQRGSPAPDRADQSSHYEPYTTSRLPAPV